LAEHARENGVNIDAALVASSEPRFRYNPSFESIYAMGPSIPAVLLMLFPSILMAVGIAREKEIGTITNFYVTPTTRLEFLIGKQLPYIAIGMANFAILTVIVVLVLGVPLKGSFLALALGALLYVAASTGCGLVISSVTSSQVAAVFVVGIFSMLPTVQFSGLAQPVSTLEGGARLMGSLWPTGYYVHLSVGAFTKGLSFTALSADILALAAFTPVLVFTAAALLRKQEK
jgi:ribosome-dependent ATPase